MKLFEVQNDDSVTVPCRTSDGGYLQAYGQEVPCNHYAPLLAAIGIRSSLHDMLDWSIAVLTAEQRESDSVEETPTLVKARHTA